MLRSARAADAQARLGRPRVQDADRHVGARVRERRIALGLTQQQLAELVGITYQQAHKYEKGLNRIAAGRLAALARSSPATSSRAWAKVSRRGRRPSSG